MMNEKELIEIAEGIEKYISDKLIKAYFESFSENSDEKIIGIIPYLKRLANRSREYKHQSFVVLVVGPVKSGKSTFVNLVANEYVSPTHFLECTGRPSIISKGSSREITIYHSKDTNNKAGQIEDIFDSLNGLIDKAEIADVDIKTVELNEKNIGEYVKLDLNSNNVDETLITSITTNANAGGLLQDNVLLIDMAGFDGAKVNMANTPYEKIVERADVIIFVQSSNSAISKVSSEFFSIINKHNGKAPICLIHNIFDSAYWRPDELKKNNADEHIKYAVSQLQSAYHLTIDESRAFNVNLGMVSDLRSNNNKYNYTDVLKEAEREFLDVEKKIADFFSGRGIIRVQNCIERTKNKSKELSAYVGEIKVIYDNTLERYNSLSQKFDNKRISSEDIQCDGNIKIEDSTLLKFVTEQYSVCLKELEAMTGPIYATNACNLIGTFLFNIKSEFEGYLNSQVLEKGWQQSVKDKIADINRFFKEEGFDSKVNHNNEVPKIVIDFNVGIKPASLFNDTIPYYRKRTVKRKINYVYNMLIGQNDPQTPSNNFPSLIEKKVRPEMFEKILQTKATYINESVEIINKEIDRVKCTALNKIIPSIDEFNKNKELVETFVYVINPLNEIKYE